MNLFKDFKAPTEYGKGTHIELDGNELAHAIRSYLYAQGVVIDGCSTVRIVTQDGDMELCNGASVYVDPSGRVLHEGEVVK